MEGTDFECCVTLGSLLTLASFFPFPADATDPSSSSDGLSNCPAANFVAFFAAARCDGTFPPPSMLCLTKNASEMVHSRDVATVSLLLGLPDVGALLEF